MRKALVLIGGLANLLFFLFHIYLGWQLHYLDVNPGMRALLETFNLGGTLMIAFFALVSLAFPGELLATRVGRSTVGVIVGVYLSRAIAEVTLFPRASLFIVLVCLLTVGIYALAALLPAPAEAAVSTPVAARSPGAPAVATPPAVALPEEAEEPVHGS